MDPSVVKALHDAFKKAMDEPSFTATLATFDMPHLYMSSDTYHNYAMNQIAEEGRLIEELGLKEH
jgi:tripartite-type tricarboxylate transporter receptor subunit TctC